MTALQVSILSGAALIFGVIIGLAWPARPPEPKGPRPTTGSPTRRG
jgi:hypothetical protein